MKALCLLAYDIILRIMNGYCEPLSLRIIQINTCHDKCMRIVLDKFLVVPDALCLLVNL